MAQSYSFVLSLVMATLQIGATHEHGDGYKPDGEILRVLVNSSAQIKCDVGSSLPDDKVLLVVWYKNNLPIYSYDTRGAHAGTPSHWRDEEVLEDRAVFRTHKEPAELIINPVKEKDAGNFRCRVDFKLSQTRNNNVNLEVVVPPQQPTIFNERRLRIDSRAGPYEEGGSLEVTCVVYGGTPPPTVTWLMNGQMQNSIVDYSYDGSINSKLVVRNLSRIHQHAVYTCQASNFHKKYVATNITIELYLRPLLVEIAFNNQPMSADRKYEIECQAIGSRPPAKITWWMGSTDELHAHSQKVSEDGNVSVSVLAITPTREDHGKTLSCRATNELVRNGIRETSMKLNVFFVPTLQLDLGSNLNPEDIEEGDDVYFECKVHANPAAYKVVWKHNNQIIQHNQRAGVIVSNGDLALQGVTRHQAGNYTCTASNVEGDGDSNSVVLKVMYKPICRPDQKKIYGVARNEAAEILCEVDAFPPPQNFKWSFNNTAETFDMPQSGFRAHSAQGSTLTYTPVKEMDFGTIMCWADNNVGQQKEACVFHLIAAGKPEAPTNCTVVNQTSESLEVYCIEGFDGGLRQWFLMEIFDEHNGALQANISSKYSILSASLDSGRLFKIFIYAVNLRGRSEPMMVEGFTLKAAEKQTVALTSYKGSQANFELTPILSVGIFVGVLVAVVCIGIGTIAALKLRSHKQQQKYQHQNQKFSRPGNLQIKDKISLPLSHSEEMYDEKNPDVVPYNEVDGEYKQKSATQTPSGHLSTTSEAEISCKPATTDERGDSAGGATVGVAGLYTSNNKDDELHYAELSLSPGGVGMVGISTPAAAAAAAAPAASKKLNSMDCSNNMLLQSGVGGVGMNSLTSSGRKLLPTLAGANICSSSSSSTLQRHSHSHSNNNNRHMPGPPPPAYEYFEEPTIYAQIDHYKTSNAAPPGTSGSGSSSMSPFPPCMSSPTSQGTPSTVSPGTVQMYTLPQHPGGYHTLPHNHHHQHQLQHDQQQQQHQNYHQQQQQQQQQPIQLQHHSGSSSLMHMMSVGGGGGGAGAGFRHGTLPMPPTYQQQQQHPLGQMLVSSNSGGLAASATTTTTAAVTSPSSALSGLPGVGKTYSREIVTVRTPLMYSQQESCV